MKRIGAALLVVFAILGWARAQSVEEQLKKLETDRAAAVIKGDVDAIAKQTADDYTLININGQMSGKAQTLDAIKSGQIKLTQDDLSDMKVHVYGNTAVVTGKADVKGVVAGKEMSGPIAFTRVWVKKAGKWESVAFQQTKVQ
jgi:ketosteroid isomerase-like protein